MALKPALPHLSLEGFITNQQSIMTKVYEHFIASDKSQSNTYKEHIGSLKYLVHEHKSVSNLRVALTNTLSGMYGKYFDLVVVNVDVVDDPGSSTLDITIDIVASSDGVEYKLSRSLQMIDNVVQKFDKLREVMYD